VAVIALRATPTTQAQLVRHVAALIARAHLRAVLAAATAVAAIAVVATVVADTAVAVAVEADTNTKINSFLNQR
jgi:hypothetical protein